MREQGWAKKFMELLYEQNWRLVQCEQNPTNEAQALYEKAKKKLLDFAVSDGEVTDDHA